MKIKKIVVAGATGFVGKRFCEVYAQDFEITALTRSHQEIPHCRTRRCDLFSLLETEAGVKGAQIGIYLVHSMLPSAKLTQGGFEDYDLIAADNFARACEKEGIEQIIYLGGIIPDDEELSLHLRSRLEVEKVLAARKPKLSIVRSGLIIGKGGSTALILLKLVNRLHILICPSWTRTPTQAIDVDDAVKLLGYCIGNSKTYDKCFDIGSGPPLSYRKLLTLTAKATDQKRLFIDVPFFTPFLSHLWLTLISRAPRSLTRPIVESLKHPIICRNHELEELAAITPIDLLTSIRKLDTDIKQSKNTTQPRAYQKIAQEEKLVRSIQRLYLPKNWDAHRVAEEYLNFLNKHSFGLLRVKVQGEWARFFLLKLPIPLLIIQRSTDRSFFNRELFYVREGLLSRYNKKARLEFRVIDGVHTLISAIHDYCPKLPWWLYIASQAPIHNWVMKRFSRYLQEHYGD